jgi:hypothetical protein
MLDEEIRYYEENLSAWLEKYEGRIALVKGRELVGVFNTDDEAISTAARLFGLKDVLIRKVQRFRPSVQVPALALGIIHAGIP